jgi:predicted metal-binding membrane protein
MQPRVDGADSAPARVQASIERLLSRNALISAGALVAAAALAWAWLLTSGMAAMPKDGHAMAAMTPDPWSAGYLGPAFVMWSIMMVAMMLPSAAPMILLHARIDRTPAPARRLANTALLASAYLLVWTGFSGLAALAQALLIDLGLLSTASLALGSRALAAGLLITVALYQLTPAKAACLDQCRSPIHLVMRFRSPEGGGALRLGLAHGLYCVGCCSGLMLLLFAAGVMNLAWVALLAAIMFIEKVAPPRVQASRLIAGLLLAGAVLLLAIG